MKKDETLYEVNNLIHKNNLIPLKDCLGNGIRRIQAEKANIKYPFSNKIEIRGKIRIQIPIEDRIRCIDLWFYPYEDPMLGDIGSIQLQYCDLLPMTIQSGTGNLYHPYGDTDMNFHIDTKHQDYQNLKKVEFWGYQKEDTFKEEPVFKAYKSYRLASLEAILFHFEKGQFIFLRSSRQNRIELFLLDDVPSYLTSGKSRYPYKRHFVVG